MAHNNPHDKNDLARKNRRVLLMVGGIIAVMITLVSFSVPLYNLFCRVTGFGGTTQIADQIPDTVLDREVTIAVTTRVANGLPWNFEANVYKVTMNIGQAALASFTATNHSNRRTTGTAIYNVTPAKVGKYFHKTQCFCFEEQAINAGETAHFPVRFFVDPSIADDPTLSEVTDISLTYTFYPTDSDDVQEAMDEFYNRPDGAYTKHIPEE